MNNEEKDQQNKAFAKAIYGEVVDVDCYRIGQLDFVPDIVFDIGANIGTFTRFTRKRFPNAPVFAVEPDDNYLSCFKQYPLDPKVTLIEAALGQGDVIYLCGTGPMKSYVSVGLGYPLNIIKGCDLYQPNIGTKMVSLGDVMLPNWKPGMKTILKVDCEGAENCLWQDPVAMDLLCEIDYFVVELHYHAICGGDPYDEAKQVTNAALKSLEETHCCTQEHTIFFARKRS